MAEANTTVATEEVVEKKAPAKKTAAKKPAAEKTAAKKPAAKKAAPQKDAEKAPAKTAAEKAPKKAAAKKAEKAEGTLTVKLVRSLSGRKKDQIATAASLGLTRVGKVSVQPDNAATAGKIVKISHLVEVTKA